MDKVTTICCGQALEWEIRWNAIDFFMEETMVCDGSQKGRYTSILLKLMAGEMVCTDEN